MYLFSLGSGSTNFLEHHSKWEDPALGINLSAESNAGFSSENSDICTSASAIYDLRFCYMYVLSVDVSKMFFFK